MIDAFIGHVSTVLSGPNGFAGASNEPPLDGLTAAGMLSKIHRIQMNDLGQLHVLYTALERHPNVRVKNNKKNHDNGGDIKPCSRLVRR